MSTEVIIGQVTEDKSETYHYALRKLVTDFFPEYTPATLEYFFDNSRSLNLVAFKSMFYQGDILISASSRESIIGILLASRPFGGISNAHWFAIDPKYQGIGISIRMLRFYEDIAREMGVHAIRFKTAFKNIKFYQRQNYELIGQDPESYFGVPTYIFKKRLQAAIEGNFLG